MNIIGYETGPIACKAAFTADFDMAAALPLQQIVTNLEVGRKIMDVRPGMRHKYTPLRSGNRCPSDRGPLSFRNMGECDRLPTFHK